MTQLIASYELAIGCESTPRKSLDVIAAYGRLLFAWRKTMEEEIFTREEAASYLKVDKGTITQWIRSGRLPAAKINPEKPKSPYRICKSDCIAALKSVRHNSAVNAVGMQEEKACQSNYAVARGTATSSRQMDQELDALLKHRTRGKRKSFTIV
ncbi:helix-turn-helix domain-containing protein [Enterobacter hormaechei]|uniref:helix-turn-helix domain-containing protein n=2 Tax=Enterobacter cloacae complex TaxID=354276 RepID=UPI0023FA34D2|nr:helix-turn-helix domain-containing protein [Enterobacter hormaechei]MDF7702153.1 helix-turn-helix domain-containing protein [Enterobacter hormaechei subsp. steigerwaltii]